MNFLLLYFLTNNLFSQEIFFTFTNPEITNNGVDDFYEVDVQISSTTDFKLGYGLLYFNYNTDAFGLNVNASGNLEITRPEGSILQQDITAFPTDIYEGFLPVDNTDRRFAYSWRPAFADVQFPGDNITSTPTTLFHIKIKYVDKNKDPMLEFESDDPFPDQTYTACGGTFVADCVGAPGVQIVDDFYNSSGSKLSNTFTGNIDNTWDNAGNWSLNIIPNSGSNITLNTGNTIIASGDIHVNNLSIENNTGLTVGQNVNSTGDVSLGSGSSIIANNSSSFNLTYKRDLDQDKWYLISSPVENQSVVNFVAANNLRLGSGIGTSQNIALSPYSNLFNLGDSNTWNYYTVGQTDGENGDDTSDLMDVGKGYAVSLSSSGELSFSGIMPTDNGVINIDSHDQSNNGFNLIGNPFPSYINSSDILNEEANTEYLNETTMWKWNANSDTYETFNLANPTDLSPTEAFFVEAIQQGSNILDGEPITFNKQWLQHQPQEDSNRQLEQRPEIELFLHVGDVSVKTDIFYIDGTTTGFDNGYDSTLFNGGSNALSIFSHLVSDNDGSDYAIQSLPPENYEDMVIPIGMNVSAGDEINIQAHSTNLPEGIHVYLEDTLENTITRIDEENSNFTITLSEDLNTVGRFYLHTNTSSILDTDNQEFKLDKIRIFYSEESLMILGLEQDAKVSLYSLNGKEIIKRNIRNTIDKKIPLPKLSKGVYFVTLKTSNAVKHSKIIIY